jgi:Na+/H+-translocating membrane pyrophosphatase
MPKIDNYLVGIAVACGVGMLCLPALPNIFVLGCCIFGIYFISWLAKFIMSKDDGTPAMRKVSHPIKEGAQGFLQVQYRAIFRIATILAFVILLSYLMR